MVTTPPAGSGRAQGLRTISRSDGRKGAGRAARREPVGAPGGAAADQPRSAVGISTSAWSGPSEGAARRRSCRGAASSREAAFEAGREGARADQQAEIGPSVGDESPAPNSAGPNPPAPPAESESARRAGLSGQAAIAPASSRGERTGHAASRSDSDSRARTVRPRRRQVRAPPRSPRVPEDGGVRRPGADAPPPPRASPAALRRPFPHRRPAAQKRADRQQDGEIPPPPRAGPLRRDPPGTPSTGTRMKLRPLPLAARAGAPLEEMRWVARGSQRQKRAGRPVLDLSEGRRRKSVRLQGEKVRLDRIAPSDRERRPGPAARRAAEARGFIAALARP